MEKVLYFLSHYNAQIIQAGFAVVFFLIIVYVYRAFFMAGSLSGDTDDVVHSPAIEQKLNQILEIQKSKSGLSSSHSGVETGSGASLSQGAEEEIDKLKAEIYNLRQQLNDAAKNSVPSDQQSSAAAMAAEATGREGDSAEVEESSPAAKEMVVKVKELESRLAEYEIIADDIAELSQLRTDNAKLKEQLSKVQGSDNKQADAAVTEDLSSQAAIDAVFATATADLSADPVAASEQNLITEFETTTQKKDDE